MPKRATPPIQRTTRSRPADERQQRRQRRPPTTTSGQSAPKASCRPGREVVAPDAGVGRVVGDAEVGPAGLQALRVRQRDRPEVLDLGQRVAGDDQVAQVPVAAAGERPARTTRRAAARRRPAGASAITATRQRRRPSASTVDLGPGREPDGEPGRGERPAERRRRVAALPSRSRVRPGVDQDRDRGQQQRRGDEVVLRRAGLAHDQGVALEQDRRGDDRQVARGRRAGRCTRRPGTRPPASRS